MKEEEVRPQKIFEEYLELARKDVRDYFGDVAYDWVACPACGHSGEFAFHQSGFNYEECPECYTLYVSPRPQAESFEKYYREAPSTKFWATTFYKETAEARREKIWKPKAKLVAETVSRLDPTVDVVVDVGGGYGIFGEEIRTWYPDAEIVIVEPAPHLASVCQEKGLSVVESFLEELTEEQIPQGKRRLFTSFELFEHVHSPQQFLESMKGVMNPGDLFLFTTLSGMGVDIRVMWEESRSVSPPHHLNFVNPKSAEILLERCGFEVLTKKTPGVLDIDIMKSRSEAVKDRFWSRFLDYADESELEEMQRLVTKLGLSSHMMMVARSK